MSQTRGTVQEVLGRGLELGGVEVRNRFVKAAMSETLGTPEGAPSERLIRLYERWGRGGVGMMITGHVLFDPRGRAELGNVVIEDERYLPELTEWARRAQANGAQLWMQINHAGRNAPRQVTSEPVSPSTVELKGFGPMFAPPRELSEAEILDIIKGFARTAGIAKKAGFSGVEIHGAHGYLVSQFLSPLSNLRTDGWGGTAENRRRFLIEIVRAMRGEVGPGFPIGVKLNSADFQRGGFSEEESMAVVEVLAEEGIDLLEISGGNYESPEMTGITDSKGELRESTRAREAYFLEYAKQVRELVDIPLLLTGGMRSAETMARVIEEGHVDLIGLARPMAVEPDLPADILSGQSEGAIAVNPLVGIKLFDSLLQVSWFQRQLHRMGDGKEPSLSLGYWSTILLASWETFPYHPRKHWYEWRRRKASARFVSAPSQQPQ